MVTAAEAKLGGAEEAIDNQDVPVDAAVGDLELAFRADDEERRHLALDDAARKLDIDPTAVVVDGCRPPRRIVAAQGIAVVARRGGGNDRRGRSGMTLRSGRLWI